MNQSETEYSLNQSGLADDVEDEMDSDIESSVDSNNSNDLSSEQARAPPRVEANALAEQEPEENSNALSIIVPKRSNVQKDLKRKISESSDRPEHRDLCLAALDGTPYFPTNMHQTFVERSNQLEAEKVLEQHKSITELLTNITHMRSSMDIAARTLTCQRDINRIKAIREITINDIEAIKQTVKELRSELHSVMYVLFNMNELRNRLRSQGIGTNVQDETIDAVERQMTSMRGRAKALETTQDKLERNINDYDAVLEHRRKQPNFHELAHASNDTSHTFVHSYVDKSPAMVNTIVKFLSSELISNKVVAGIFAKVQHQRRFLHLNSGDAEAPSLSVNDTSTPDSSITTVVGIPIGVSSNSTITAENTASKRQRTDVRVICIESDCDEMNA